MKMENAAWPHLKLNLAFTLQRAAIFLDDLPAEVIQGAAGRQSWAARWTKIGDAHYHSAELKTKNGSFDEAADNWLCGLTALEVARRLVDEDDPLGGEISARVEAGIRRVGLSSRRAIEQMRISCSDDADLVAYYLAAEAPDTYAPAVICISREEETGATLLGRLLPALIGRRMSVLVVSHDDLCNHVCGQPEMLLSCCWDYLSLRPDVDSTRIGVYGEGLSAILATDFALSDSRIAAAVCDGGLWAWIRTSASVSWMTNAADLADEHVISARRSRLARRLRCPALVVAGGRGIVSISEAIKLQTDCMASRIDLEVSLPRMIKNPEGEIENFVTSDHCILGWLERKLTHDCNLIAAADQGSREALVETMRGFGLDLDIRY